MASSNTTIRLPAGKENKYKYQWIKPLNHQRNLPSLSAPSPSVVNTPNDNKSESATSSLADQLLIRAVFKNKVPGNEQSCLARGLTVSTAHKCCSCSRASPVGLQGGNGQKRSRIRGKAAMGCHGVGTAFVFNTFLSFKAVTDIAGALVRDSGHC